MEPRVYRPAYARLSFANGTDQQEPVVIVGKDFEETRQNTVRATSESLTKDTEEYLAFLYPELKDNDPGWIMNSIKIAVNGKIFSDGGGSSLGQRFGLFSTEDHAEELEHERDYRLTLTDLYSADGHNLDTMPSARWLCLVAVGSLNRITRLQINDMS